MRFILFLAAAAAAIAQTATNTIAVTASRNVTAIPDRVIYNITLQTDLAATLSDAAGKLAATGVASSDLVYVNGGPAGIEWTFQLVTPFSKMQDTSAALTRLSQPSGQPNAASPVTFMVTGQQISQEAQAAACNLFALVSDARREADRIASGAGMHVGEIVGLSEPTLAASDMAQYSVDFLLTGSLLPSLGVRSGYFALSQPASPPSCSLIVQFRLLP